MERFERLLEIRNDPNHIRVNGTLFLSLEEAGVRAGYGGLYGSFVRETLCSYPAGHGVRAVEVQVRDAHGHLLLPGECGEPVSIR